MNLISLLSSPLPGTPTFPFRKMVLSLGIVLIGTLSPSWGKELILDGDMGTLDAWEPVVLPPAAGRELIEENSPFTEVYPSNDRCVKLVDASELIHQTYLSQQISEGAGKLVWSFDYKRLENSDDLRDGGFVVRLCSGGKAALTWVGISDAVMVNVSKGKLGISASRVPAKLLQRGIWYHFRAEIDLEAQTLSGTLTSEEGDTYDLPAIQLIPHQAADPKMIDGILVGANNGPNPGFSLPILFDNFSLQQQP